MKEGYAKEIQDQRRIHHSRDGLRLGDINAIIISNSDTLYNIIGTLIDLLPAFLQQFQQQQNQSIIKSE